MTQPEALDILKSGKNVFLTGEPGAGKTYTINQFTAWLRERHRNYAITASTGIAATHIDGTTIHSWSGLGIARMVDDNLIDKLIFNRFVSRRLNEAEVLVIDEISMLDATTINNIDYILRNVRGKDFPFGGIQIVFVGDFYQLPPVVKGEAVVYAFEAQAWKDAAPVVCYLTEQHRQSDPVFLDLLSSMRRGTVGQKHHDILKVAMQNQKQETQLFTHNVDVDMINDAELKKLQAKTYRYQMTESYANPKLSWMCEDLKKQCLSPQLLELREGAVVMFTRNRFDPDTGKAIYVNGTLGKVIGFQQTDEHSPFYPLVLTKDGQKVLPQPARWVREDSHGNEQAAIVQVPLKLAWAITVHKSQGMSLDAATIDLSKTFAHGQGYVALSRVKSLAGLHLTGLNDEVFAMDPKVVEQDKIFRESKAEATVKFVEPEPIDDIPF